MLAATAGPIPSAKRTVPIPTRPPNAQPAAIAESLRALRTQTIRVGARVGFEKRAKFLANVIKLHPVGHPISRKVHHMNDPTCADISDVDRREAAKRLRAAAAALRRAAGQISVFGDTVYIDAFIDHVGKMAHDLKKTATAVEPLRPRDFRKPSRKAIPIIICDVEYPSMAAAARDHGVSSGVIKAHMEAGTLDDVGQTQVPSRAITIRGVEYPSMKAASKALHVRVNTIRKHRDAGTLANVGLKKRKRR